MWNYNNATTIWTFVTEDGVQGRVYDLSMHGYDRFKAYLDNGDLLGVTDTLNEAKRLLLLALM